MEMYYETERLILKMLHESSALDVLNFYQKNKDVFERIEPDRPHNFYTIDYQSALLRCEFQLALKQHAVRFWVFTQDHPEQIIGTISFQNILRSVYQSCLIGYKFDSDFWHHGYAAESIQKAVSIVFQEMELHRIEAFVLPDNLPSIRLLEGLGFVQEGICRSCIYLHSNWADHFRYSLINP